MAPILESGNHEPSSDRAQLASHENHEDEAQPLNIRVSQSPSPIAAPTTCCHRALHKTPGPTDPSGQNTVPQTISHTNVGPQLLQPTADRWANRQTLVNEYGVHKRSTIDPIAQQAVRDMSISRFVQPASPASPPPTNDYSHPSLFHAGPPPEDLNYSLRHFVAADPVQNANVVYTRIAIKEGRTMAGYVPALPQPRRVVRNPEDPVSEAASDSEVCGSQ